MLPVVGLGFSVVALVNLVDLEVTARALLGVQPGWLLLACALALSATASGSLRLYFFLRASGFRRPFLRCWSAFMASLTLNSFMPGRGGDLVKGYFLIENKGEGTALTGAVLLERMVDLMILCVLSFVGAILAGRSVLVMISAAAILVPVGLVGAMSVTERLPWLGRRLEGIGIAVREGLSSPGWLAAGALSALAGWMTVILLAQTLFKAVGEEVELSVTAAVMPLAILVGILPLSIAGIGTRDATLAFLLKGVVESGVALAVGILYTAVAYWFLAVIGVIALGGEVLRAVRRSHDREEG